MTGKYILVYLIMNHNLEVMITLKKIINKAKDISKKMKK